MPSVNSTPVTRAPRQTSRQPTWTSGTTLKTRAKSRLRKASDTSPLTPCTSMSSTSATCLVTSPEVLKTNSTFGSFFFQSSIAFFAHQFAPPIQPWSAVGMVTPTLIVFAAVP